MLLFHKKSICGLDPFRLSLIAIDSQEVPIECTKAHSVICCTYVPTSSSFRVHFHNFGDADSVTYMVL